jgi:hypothetical protein
LDREEAIVQAIREILPENASKILERAEQIEEDLKVRDTRADLAEGRRMDVRSPSRKTISDVVSERDVAR